MMTEDLSPAHAAANQNESTAPSPRVQRRRERTRQKIIQSSADLFSRFGYDQVRFEDIAEAADVARGTLYSFYKNKEALINEMLQSVYEKAMRGLDRVKHMEPRKSVEELLNVYCDLYESDPHGLMVAFHLPRPPGPAEQLYERFSERMRSIFERAGNLLRSRDTEVTTRLFSRSSVPSLAALAESTEDFRRQFVEHFKSLLLR